MASSSADMKGFYRQKKAGGITKSKPSSSRKNAPKKSATQGAGAVQPAALVGRGGALDLQDDYDQEEEMLRQFDMNMVYGPCIGMSRLERWQRAKNLGMNPPQQLEHLLTTGKAQLECLWDGRI